MAARFTREIHLCDRERLSKILGSFLSFLSSLERAVGRNNHPQSCLSPCCRGDIVLNHAVNVREAMAAAPAGILCVLAGGSVDAGPKSIIASRP